MWTSFGAIAQASYQRWASKMELGTCREIDWSLKDIERSCDQRSGSKEPKKIPECIDFDTVLRQLDKLRGDTNRIHTSDKQETAGRG